MIWIIVFGALWLIGLGAIALVVIDSDNILAGHGNDEPKERKRKK